jgi:Ni/Co efflux regulator RcnB
MKRLLCAVSVFALLVPNIASAQQPQNDRHRGGQHAQRPPQNSGKGNAQRPNRPGRRPSAGTPSIQPVPNPGGLRPNRPSRPNAGAPSIQPVPNPGGHRPGTRPPSNGRPTILPVPTRPGQRPSNFRPIHRPGFNYPRGYHYRRWNIGLILPSIFLSNYYFFNDWSMYGVYAPPPGYVWVRYGPDLLLVNRHNGRIRDVIYGAFY